MTAPESSEDKGKPFEESLPEDQDYHFRTSEVFVIFIT